jgi:hypothetical protein
MQPQSKLVPVSELKVIEEMPFAELQGEEQNQWIIARIYEQEFALYENERFCRQETRSAWTLWWQDQQFMISKSSGFDQRFPTLQDKLIFPDSRSFYAVIRKGDGYIEKSADPPFPAYQDKERWIVRFQIYSSPRHLPFAITFHYRLELDLKQMQANCIEWSEADTSM